MSFKNRSACHREKTARLLQACLASFVLAWSALMPQSETSAVPSPHNVRRVVLVFADDHSGSVGEWPDTDSTFVSGLINMVGSHCGVLAICDVRDTASPLLCANFCLDTGATTTIPLSWRPAAVRRNDSLKADFEQRKQAFFAQAMDILERPRDAPKTDLSGAVERIALLLGQVTNEGALKIVIFNSDCQPTTSGTTMLADDVIVTTVGARRADAVRAFGDQVNPMENLLGVLDLIQEVTAQDDLGAGTKTASAF